MSSICRCRTWVPAGHMCSNHWASTGQGVPTAWPNCRSRSAMRGRSAGRCVLLRSCFPNWAASAAVGGRLLVPREAVGDGSWQRTDWWTAAFIMLEGWHERAWEQAHGPIHSYSYRLKGWDDRAWQRAWVNRIGMFLAIWAGIEPFQHAATVRLSHDVDAISKTVPIRIKQGAFRTIAAARRRTAETTSTGGAISFMSRRNDWWHIDDVLRLEGQAERRSLRSTCSPIRGDLHCHRADGSWTPATVSTAVRGPG